jgi:GNAT superfamily N-acetyltransferase
MGHVREIDSLPELARAQTDIRALVLDRLPGWHAPPAFMELERLDREREPFWLTHEGRMFVHEENGRVTSRVLVFVAKGGGEIGKFGLFDSVDDPAAATAVLEAAARWLSARGARRMDGPFFLSMHEEVGLLVDGFELPSSIYMPFNSPQAARLLEGFGFATVRSFGTYVYDLDTCYQAIVARGGDRPDITTRGFDRSREAEEIGNLLTVYNSAFADNWGFTPLTDRQAKALVKNLLAVGNPELVRVAEREGRPVGFILCVPDVNGFLHRIRRWPGLTKIPLLLLAILFKRIRDTRVITLAIVREFQGQGISRTLIKSLATTAKAIGYRNAELSYIDTENHWMNKLMRGYNFASRKEYRIYSRSLPL